ncbi:MAG: TRAP transporter large permease, partial [Flavobacteriales bacterium]
RLGIFNPKTISVGDLFVGALLPGLLLVFLYLTYVWLRSYLNPSDAPAQKDVHKVSTFEVLSSLLPPIGLMELVLGSIIIGIATPTEAAGVGAIGATCLALFSRRLSFAVFQEVLVKTLQMTSMVFLILIGASFFSLVFRGYGGEELVQSLFEQLPGGAFGAMLLVMAVVFLLGFILDFIEITFVVVPIVGPVLLIMGIDPVWLGIMIAINLQTSFLTPPFGFALFYLRSVAPESVKTIDIYKGVIPYIGIQIFVLAMLALFPVIVTWLPSLM